MLFSKTKFFLLFNFAITFFIPSYAVTTKMFKVLDTCARYRLKELNAFEAIEKLDLEYNGQDLSEAKILVKKYCSVFTPNQNIDF